MPLVQVNTFLLDNLPQIRVFGWLVWLTEFWVFLSLAMLRAAAGRVLGVDAWLRHKLSDSAGRGNRLARIGLLIT